MKKLYLHIGLGKTGSSALQTWLSINNEALIRQGVFYADLSSDAAQGKPSSGNGRSLIMALKNKNAQQIERLLAATYSPDNSAHSAIISSELMKDVKESELEIFLTACKHLDLIPVIVVYVRSVYERAYSAYGQSVKHSGETAAFSDRHISDNLHATVNALKKYRKVFGESMMVLNYDDSKSIFASFTGAIGLEIDTLKPIEMQVNRSLSQSEMKCQRQLNALHGGVFSRHIAKYFLDSMPNKKVRIVYDQTLLSLSRKLCQEDIRWINETFALNTPIVNDLYDDTHVGPEADSSTDVLASVVDWAVEFSPLENLTEDFVNFLAAFADFLQNEGNTQGSRRVRRRLRSARTRLFIKRIIHRHSDVN
ncbi:MAG: hypothetical protein GY889_13545 [Proteobacteria bacterium]|nr:hypothetical protein [Pseudomonadota bacterium]